MSIKYVPLNSTKRISANPMLSADDLMAYLETFSESLPFEKFAKSPDR